MCGLMSFEYDWKWKWIFVYIKKMWKKVSSSCRVKLDSDPFTIPSKETTGRDEWINPNGKTETSDRKGWATEGGYTMQCKAGAMSK